MRAVRMFMTGPLVACATCLSIPGALADPQGRAATAAGQVIETRGGETVRFVTAPAWDPLEVRQDLLAGDHLRTNETGALAILFADRTQVRVGRRSDLVVKSVSAGSEGSAELTLNTGAVWARAERGGGPVKVQTPSVTTAIRGTDWSLAVDADGRSTLIVLEGVVEMANAQGSLTLTAGQAATAAIGQAPVRIIIAKPNDREQMLFHLSPQDVFNWSRPSPLPSRELRARRLAIAALPPETRTTADWLDRAEIAISTDGTAVAAAALAEVRTRRLTSDQVARADLVAGFIAARQTHYADAATLFARAIPRLDAARRPLAVQMHAIAVGLANPVQAPPVPKPAMETPQSAVVEAWRIGFLGTPDEAIAFVRQAERRFPDDPTLPAVRAAFELFAGRNDAMGEAVARARAVDPDDPFTRQAGAAYNTDAIGNLPAAHADLQAALEAAPGDSDIWDMLGSLWSEQEASREAEAAYRRAIELAPNSIVPRMNYALFLLDQSRVRAAQEQVDAVARIAPADPYLGVVRGRMRLQDGEVGQAIDDLLSASTANPAAASILAGVAAAYYQAGNAVAARQALDNAERLDPHDPIPPVMQTAIALDEYRADDAIESARRATQLYAARPGGLSSVTGTRAGGSFLADSYRFLGLDAWGRYQGDRLFDPFDATSYFDQAVVTEPHVFRFPGNPLDQTFSDGGSSSAVSSIVQGLAIDPLAASSPIGRTSFLRVPFFNAEAGGGFVAREGKPGWTGSGNIEAFSNGPVPVAVSLSASLYDDAGDRSGADTSLMNGSAFVGVTPAPEDNVVAFAVANRNEPALPVALTNPTEVDDGKTDTLVTGGAWSHVFGFRNIGTAAVSYTGARSTSDTITTYVDGTLFTRTKADTAAVTAAYDHKLGFGGLTLAMGFQASALWIDQTVDQVLDPPYLDPSSVSADQYGREGMLYADALYEVSSRVRMEGGLYLTESDITGENSTRLDPRVGIAVAPFDGHWLRVAWRSETQGVDTFTLAPVATVGLMGNLVPIDTGGRSQGLIARWDAQWTPRVFSTLEYQGRSVDGLEQTVPDSIATVAVPKARVDQIAASLNVWLGHGFGLSGTYAWTQAENRTPGPEDGEPVSLIPTHFARAGLVFVHPVGIRAGIYESYVGERELVYTLQGTDQVDRLNLDSFFTTDVMLSYEPPDKRFQLSLNALNLTDEDYWIAPGLPAGGRTFYGSLRVRF